ncbi:UDP-glucose/GDP-mannose dehydrogenase family protein [Bremerella cremea]|uniref:UDP-glucose 6-dehydrogenase n=1 Tax=Blastopirellula marina TaxID=124 RepID=A0A2S8FRZ5_9BACT|nr:MULTISPECIES: UDP-glucose/GDP-mannose dehydrogenase family protein [Pirellulaceae]PQO34952.1 UDP-glucose 6-dehydrogenase [Blastopirellula marina]RCS47453.1 UDP-glucose/GDP-mannose dehydrogenase family protein [Bremerella cremea]
MKLSVIGTGYVGLVTGTCFSDLGNDVTCIDVNQAKVDGLKKGIIPIYEPGLSELVLRNYEEGRLKFTTKASEAVPEADVVYIAVGTPQSDTGAADLSAVWKVVEDIAPHLKEDALVVVKSTVPVGTNAKVFSQLKELTGRECNVASNPEFLKEGSAIDDFMYPDRVVCGVRNKKSEDMLRQLHAPLLRTAKPILFMSPESSELTKYAANAMLATKISFINEIANLSEKVGADINDVRVGMGHDQRIGFQFLFPGLGYGGSCFPKDVRALTSLSETLDLEPRIMRAVDDVNVHQRASLVRKIDAYYGGKIAGKTFGIWGLAFKPKTDDIREAPALDLLQYLVEKEAKILVHDPEAMENVQAMFGDKIHKYCENVMDAVEGVDCLAINTEWNEYRTPDFAQLKTKMKEKVIFDGRNLFDLEDMEKTGFSYFSIGRRSLECG